jgi:hypothetical protein
MAIRLAHLFKMTEQVARSRTIVGEQNLRIHQTANFLKAKFFKLLKTHSVNYLNFNKAFLIRLLKRLIERKIRYFSAAFVKLY